MNTPSTFNNDIIFKIVFVGDMGVGKSCLIIRFTDNEFDESYKTTIGVDLKYKRLVVDQKIVKLQIWDTAGQERFRTMTSSYYRGADAIVLCYDCTDPNSFNNINEWMTEINRHLGEETYKTLIATKCDLKDKKVISTQAGQNKANEFGINFIELSAKNSENVEKLFLSTVKTLLKQRNMTKKQMVDNQSKKPNTVDIKLTQFSNLKSMVEKFFSTCC